jgi:hypothetical protein
MAVTPVGNPYVESSDLVANYPGVSEALAERIDIVGVNPFANAAARATAIPSPTEGMMSSLNDTDAVQRYDGAMWKPVGGKVLQVVSVTKVNSFTTTSASFVDVTGLSVSITPSASSSRILIMSTFQASNTTADLVYFNLVRNSTAIAQGTGGTNDITAAAYSSAPTNNESLYQVAITNLDSPATTSATTYKIQMAATGGTGAVGKRGMDTLIAASSNILVMEISA